ncbi:hypothetical protein M431DRAFT_459428 [Trichoderma harzianum CBS 226.95]|uniref:Uncharacterized protein n=1 Tax=Trichoderma harzianum CBS 226.95 TaxID=983964 RepID=A0A2T4A895_TRIHA|nr:hypothetical protein M431DRAFT_459428 [Trichoderma harzianum CBS 226.95]PTB53238.1 hypothetical protein M431DRAFT_459428 [Trichoderma harzianum CBS 226.95]
MAHPPPSTHRLSIHPSKPPDSCATPPLKYPNAPNTARRPSEKGNMRQCSGVPLLHASCKAALSGPTRSFFFLSFFFLNSSLLLSNLISLT